MTTMLLLSVLLAASPKAPCDTPQHRQFDFWAGEWVVKGPDGKVAGTNRITSIAGGCALLEEWTGSGGMTGKSLNIWDATRRRWHQTWVDSNGTLLQLDGSFTDGAMRMESSTDRITWSPLPEGALRQVWEKSADGGESWKVVFDGRYARQK